MLSLGKPLQIEACNVSITSYTQDKSPITKRAWIDITFQEMTLVHPIYICVIDTEPLLIGQDLLDRLAPLIDCHHGHMWAQVATPKPLGPGGNPPVSDGRVAVIQESRKPLPMLMPFPEPDPDSDPSVPPAGPQPPRAGSQDSIQDHRSFLCSLKNTNTALYSTRVVGGVHINGVSIPDVLLALWSEKSAVSQGLYDELCLYSSLTGFAQRSHRLLSAESPQALLKAMGVCALSIQIGKKQVTHFVSVVPQLQPPFYVRPDLLVRLGAQLDTVNQVLWSQVGTVKHPLNMEPQLVASGHTIPQACQVASEVDLTIPARTAGVPIRLVILKGQKVPGSQAFFQPFFELNLSVCGTPLLELDNRSTYLLVQNPTHIPVQVTARRPLGMLIDSSFHDFELTIPVIGELPPSLARNGNPNYVLSTFPTKMITIARHESLQNEAICSATLGTGGDMVIYALVTQPGDVASGGDGACSPPKEPYPGFESEIDQQLAKADALTSEIVS